jgi:hypothetical protein
LAEVRGARVVAAAPAPGNEADVCKIAAGDFAN